MDVSTDSPAASLASTSTSTPAATKRVPCDACHQRKIRCDDGAPCSKCLHSDLDCTRTIVRKRRGPKKGSGTVLRRLRENGGKITRSVDQDNTAGDNAQDHRLIPSSQAFSSSSSSPSFLPSLSLQQSATPHLTKIGPNAVNHVPASALAVSRCTPTRRQDSPFAISNIASSADSYPNDASPFSLHGFLPRVSPHSAPSAFTNSAAHSPLSLGSYSPWPITHRTSFGSDAGENRFLSVNELASKILGPPGDFLPLAADPSAMSSSRHPLSFSTTGLPHDLDITQTDRDTWTLSAQARDSDAPQVLALSARSGIKATLISLCIAYFFKNLYPIMPVIHESSFRSRLYASDVPPDEGCLLIAMCAMTVLYISGSDQSAAQEHKDISDHLIRHFLTARLEYDYTECLSLAGVLSSLFLSVVYFEHKKLRSWWFYLREACALAYDLRLSDDASYASMHHVSAICHRRTLALLFVTERGAGLLRNKPVTLRELTHLPEEYFDDEDPNIIAGFRCLCRMFALVDADFFKLWNAADLNNAEAYLSAPHIARVQDQLGALPLTHANLTEVQRVDVMVTQQWLRLIYWQAAMRQGMVTSAAQNEAFQYAFPVKVAHTLCEMLHDISLQAVLVHGLGIFEKLFEIAYSLMDALALSKVPLAESEDLKILFSYLSASSVSHDTYVRMLVTKLDGHTSLQSLHGQKLLQSTDLPAKEQRRR